MRGGTATRRPAREDAVARTSGGEAYGGPMPTMAVMTNEHGRGSVMDHDVPEPPVARILPRARIHHHDVVQDPYEWMRNSEDPAVAEYVRAENEYCQARTAHLRTLRTTLFEEIRSHVQETDMSVPVRVDGYWYFGRTVEGRQYGMQCRIPVRSDDDWDPPVVDPSSVPGSLPGEEIIFDANAEAEGHDFFRLGGMDVSRDGRRMLYGVDVTGNERYDFRVRDLTTGEDLPDRLTSLGGACLTPDGRWVFTVEVDDAWRPCAIWRHRVGTDQSADVEVYRERDERFWISVGMSFDESLIVISVDSKTTSEMWTLDVHDPQGEFEVFIPRREGIEYSVGFSTLEGAGDSGEDVPIAVVYHNVVNPNFEFDVVDLRSHRPPYSLGEGIVVAQGSPYGCEKGDAVIPGASALPAGTAYDDPRNPDVLRGARGLTLDGMSVRRDYVVMAYRAQGLPHMAVISKREAVEDYRAGRPWGFREVVVPELTNDDMAEDEGRLYSVGMSGNPSYDAPRVRYSFTSLTRPGELHEYDPVGGEDRLLKRAEVPGGFDPRNYAERRVWITARDGERIPVSLAWRRDLLSGGRRPDGSAAPMFITGYGAYEISSDPGFSTARLNFLDRGVLYAVAHVRGGGEMGRAWYEQGRRLSKKHTFEDFVDVTEGLQRQGWGTPATTVANGGSAGGLLMGAVANMAPSLYAGIEADVPFVDALTSILDPSLPLTVTEWDEWGDPLHDEEVYRYMKSYSPYENVPRTPDEARHFPRILVTTSMNDTRVLVVEPLKWVARLQSVGVDAIERIEVEAGHGGASGRYRQWEDLAFENAWCLDVMGITR